MWRLLTSVATMADDALTRGFDLDRAWRLHLQVAVRPAACGALLYHVGTMIDTPVGLAGVGAVRRSAPATDGGACMSCSAFDSCRGG